MTIAALLIAFVAVLLARHYRNRMLAVGWQVLNQQLTIISQDEAAEIFYTVIREHGCPEVTADIASPGTIAECKDCGAQWKASELTIDWDESGPETYARPDQTWVLAGHRDHLPVRGL